MKYPLKKSIVVVLVVIISALSLNYSSGPAYNGVGVSGAPFGYLGGGYYCSYCHSSGNYSPTISLQLLSNGVPVTGNYVPGWTYTVRITRSANANLPVNGGFGFQLTCATTPGNIDINNWGTLPAGTANRFTCSHHYIEHTS